MKDIKLLLGRVEFYIWLSKNHEYSVLSISILSFYLHSLSDWKLEHIRRVDVNQVSPMTLFNTTAHKMHTAN